MASPGAACSPNRPHGKEYHCGYWYQIRMPVCDISRPVVAILMNLARLGLWHSIAPDREPPKD